jgi:hypothetical protein
MGPIFERVFFPARRRVPSRASASSVSSSLTTRDIESYYARVIGNCLERMLVQPDDVELLVRRAGTAPSGLTSFAAYVRILRWNPIVTPVLLQNIPVIDARIRKVVSASVLLEHTHFAGLWFQVASTAEGSPTSLLGLPAELKYQSGPVPVGAR